MSGHVQFVFKQKYSGNETVDIQRTQQDGFHEATNNSRNCASVKISEDDYQLDGASIGMGWLKADSRRSSMPCQICFLYDER